MSVQKETLQAMKSEKRWVVCNPKRKIPQTPSLTGLKNARSNDPDTWVSYERAREFVDAARLENDEFVLGFVLGDGWCGIDLDHVNPSQDRKLDSIESEDAKRILGFSDSVCYSEWSPSGDGAHCIFKADIPQGYRSVKKLGKNRNEQPMQVEFYGGGRFFTVTFDEFTEKDYFRDQGKPVGEILLDIAGEYFKQGRPNPISNNRTLAAYGATQVDKYVSTIIQNTRIQEGERNNKLFSIAGNIAKKVNYSGNEVLRLLKVVNQNCCSEPVSEFELFKIAESSIKNGTPRVDTPAPISSLYAVEEFTEPPSLIERLNALESTYDKQQLDPEQWESLPGFIGDYIKRIKDLQTEYQPDLALAGALTCMSALVAGRIECSGTVPAIMAVGLAPSGAGKDFARKLTADILKESGHADRNGAEHISSGEGLVSALATQGPQLFQLDEAAELFSEMGQRVNPVAQRTAKFLKEAYSKAGHSWKPNARADAKANIEVHYAFASIYFTTTSKRWWSSFPEDGIADGMLGRCLVFEAEGYAPRVGKEYKPATASQRLIDQASVWADPEKAIDEKLGNFIPVQWKFSEEASKLICEYMGKIIDKAVADEHGGSEADAIWMRSRDRISRVALLIAASHKGPTGNCTVDEWHMELAIDLVKATNYRVLHRLDTEMATSEEQKIKIKILAALDKHGELKRGALYKKGVRCDAKVRDAALKALVEEGEIELRTDGMFRRVKGAKQAL